MNLRHNKNIISHKSIQNLVTAGFKISNSVSPKFNLCQTIHISRRLTTHLSCVYKHTQSPTQTQTQTHIITLHSCCKNCSHFSTWLLVLISMAKKKSSTVASDQNNSKPETRQRTTNPGLRLIGGRIYDSESGKTCHQVLWLLFGLCPNFFVNVCYIFYLMFDIYSNNLMFILILFGLCPNPLISFVSLQW